MDVLHLSDDDLKRYKTSIVKGIGEFVKVSGAKGAVFGLSGGIDSSLVGALGKLALGNRLHALIMPERGVSRPEDVEHAVEFAKEQDIKYSIIEIKDVVTLVGKKYPDLLGSNKAFHARSNLTPRIRMLFNYFSSNKDDLIVLGTGNKTELMLGYFTKYGDGGVDFLPIGDLYKTQVHQLACHLEIPECIVEKPPSAGLWQGQTDEEEIGESYENIDMILHYIHDKKQTVEITAKSLNLDIKQVEGIRDMMEKNSHKRFPPPIFKIL
jgi:NAD+ synthase